mgnify:CR=1 FL=1
MFFQRKDVKEQKIEELLLENYNRYYRLAYSYVHNEADAADIVQNGAYKAIRNSDSLKDGFIRRTADRTGTGRSL